MTELIFPDLVKKVGGVPLDVGQPDWSKSLTTVLSRPELVPNGTQEDPTIVRVPELYRGVSSIEPRRPDARFIHVICDKGAGFHFPTLGPGSPEGSSEVEAAIADPSLCAGLKKKYRTRFLLGGIGGHGWKFHGILRGPKLDGLPARSPSGPGARNCLEAQHGFWAKDFGYDLTDQDIDDGIHGWDLCGVTIERIWGDAFSPGTTVPNTRPAREMHIYGGKFSHLGRMGILTTNVLGWSCRHAEFGHGIPSSIIHCEPNSKNPRVVGNGVFESNEIYSGANLFHITGEVAEYENLLIRANERWDNACGGRIMVGPRKPDGTARARNIQVIDNLHHKIKDGQFVGDYVNCDGVTHQRNIGPLRKGWVTSSLLRQRGCASTTLAPNAYTYVPR